MEQDNQQQAPQNINFDGDDYNVQDLTPRVANEFNTLFRIQNELNDLSYQIKKCQAAQTVITEDPEEKESLLPDCTRRFYRSWRWGFC